MNTFQVNDWVKIIGPPIYGGVGCKNDIGIIVRIRERYKNTPNEYNQYKVDIKEKQNSNINSIDDMYEIYSIIRIENTNAEIP